MGFNYIGGMDIMCAKGWVISDNVFTGICGGTGEARGAIFLWHNSSDCLIERLTRFVAAVLDALRLYTGITCPREPVGIRPVREHAAEIDGHGSLRDTIDERLEVRA